MISLWTACPLMGLSKRLTLQQWGSVFEGWARQVEGEGGDSGRTPTHFDSLSWLVDGPVVRVFCHRVIRSNLFLCGFLKIDCEECTISWEYSKLLMWANSLGKALHATSTFFLTVLLVGLAVKRRLAKVQTSYSTTFKTLPIAMVLPEERRKLKDIKFYLMLAAKFNSF